MRYKVSTPHETDITDSAKARISRELRKGDKALIAEITKASPVYVKKVLAEKRSDKSALARRIWNTANRLTIERNRLKGELGA